MKKFIKYLVISLVVTFVIIMVGGSIVQCSESRDTENRELVAGTYVTDGMSISLFSDGTGYIYTNYVSEDGDTINGISQHAKWKYDPDVQIIEGTFGNIKSLNDIEPDIYKVSGDTLIYKDAIKFVKTDNVPISHDEYISMIEREKNIEAYNKKCKEKEYEAYAYIKDALKETLNDPSSFTILDSKVNYNPSERYYKIYIDFNANNAFGGKVRNKAYFKVTVDDPFSDNPKYHIIEKEII